MALICVPSSLEVHWGDGGSGGCWVVLIPVGVDSLVVCHFVRKCVFAPDEQVTLYMAVYHKLKGILVWLTVKFWNFFPSPRWKPVGGKCQGLEQTGLTFEVC